MNKHVYSLGPDHNICDKCGNDLRTVGLNTECAGSRDEFRDKLIKAARERGRHDGIDHITGLLELERTKALAEDNKPLANFIWHFTRRTIWK